MDAEKTGNLINFLRTKMGITQKELAAKINVSDKAVSKWERGDGCPDVGILPVLAQNLECDVDSLIKGELPSTTPRKELTEEEVQALLAASSGGDE
nr:helix-turn-helix domain-containing protein [Treponema sp.]